MKSRSRRETESEQGAIKYHAVDPKPSDLLMARRKLE